MSRPTKRNVPPQIDDVDRGIIEQLQEDGRRTFGRIAEAVGVSEATVRQRVQRLLEADIMRIVAVTDPTALGRELRGTVAICADGDLDVVAAAIAEIQEVDYVVVTAGAYDALVEVFAENMTHFYSVLDRVRRVTGVRSAETLMYLRVVKQTYPWPPA